MRLLQTGFFPAPDEFVPSIASGLPVDETWNVLNATGTLNGDNPWSDNIGTHGWNIVTGAAQLESAGAFTTHGGRMVHNLGTDDYEVFVEVGEYAHSGSGLLTAGPAIRFQGDASFTCYWVGLAQQDAGARTVQLYRVVNGTTTILGSAGTSAGTGSRLGLRGRGTRLIARVAGLPVLTVTDSAIPTGRYPGLLGIAGTGNRVRIDTLSGRAIHVVPPELLRQGAAA